MKVLFLGTSNALPRPGRGQTALFVESAGTGHLVDCGDGAPSKLLLDPSADLAALRALLITHLHPDHSAGLFVLLHLLHMRAGDEPLSEGFRLCMPAGPGTDAIVSCLPAFHLEPDKLAFDLELTPYRAGRSFQAGALKVTPWRTSHCEEAHGLTLEAEGRRVVFSGDLGSPEELGPHACGADLVITECAHFHPRDLVAALEGTGARRYAITHMHDLILDRLEEAERFFQPLRKEGDVIFARDGLVVDVA